MIYEYPDDNDPIVKRVKHLASRVGRSFYDEEKYNNHFTKLKNYLQTLDSGRLRYWASIMLIDPKYCGATGAGAYIAVASRVVNELSRELLCFRASLWRLRHGDSLFVIDPNPKSEQFSLFEEFVL